LSQTNFSSLPLSQPMLSCIESLGYHQMTPIQAQSLPHILEGKDIIGQGKTGSGKTVAFGIGLLTRIKPEKFNVQALVLCPTRELAEQVGKEIRRLARFTQNIKLLTLCGGTPIAPQVTSLEKGVHIIVATPGRLMDHLSKQTLNLKAVNTLVLDEADRMLDMGFNEAITSIIAEIPKTRQTLLFSATFPDSIKKMSASIQRKPISVKAETNHEPTKIEQLFFEIKKHERNNTLLLLLTHYKPASVVIFCKTKRDTQDVADMLNEKGHSAVAIHGDLEQRDRNQVLIRFSNQSCPILVATDVAARGLDIEDLEMVINYELPRDAEVYVHRIGRTGRAGKGGLAMSLFMQSEVVKLNAIEDLQGRPCRCDVPESLDHDNAFKLKAGMTTLQIDAGRKSKIRPGDILGAITGDAGFAANIVGKIDVLDNQTYVAVNKDMANQLVKRLADGKIKGRKLRVRKLD